MPPLFRRTHPRSVQGAGSTEWREFVEGNAGSMAGRGVPTSSLSAAKARFGLLCSCMCVHDRMMRTCARAHARAHKPLRRAFVWSTGEALSACPPLAGVCKKARRVLVRARAVLTARAVLGDPELVVGVQGILCARI